MQKTVKIRGEDVQVEVAGNATETELHETALEMYRKQHDIVSPDELREFRGRMGISGKDFAALMGFSQTTIVAYENGTLPTDNNNVQLKASLTDKHFLEHFYEENQEKLSAKARRKVAEYLDTYQYLDDAAWL